MCGKGNDAVFRELELLDDGFGRLVAQPKRVVARLQYLCHRPKLVRRLRKAGRALDRSNIGNIHLRRVSSADVQVAEYLPKDRGGIHIPVPAWRIGELRITKAREGLLTRSRLGELAKRPDRADRR